MPTHRERTARADAAADQPMTTDAGTKSTPRRRRHAPANPFGVAAGSSRGPAIDHAGPPRDATDAEQTAAVTVRSTASRARAASYNRRRRLCVFMSDIDRFRPDDRRGVDTLYRRTHGADAAEAIRLRWDWQHRRNPYNPTGQPGIWVAREGPTVVGHYPTLPVRLSLKGIEVDGAWGADAMIAPERDRQGLDEALVRAWDRNSGAVLALGAVGRAARRARSAALAASRTSCPCLVKPLTRRAVRAAAPADAVQPADLRHDATRSCRSSSRSRPLRAECEPIRRFDHAFTALWERLAPKFDLAVRRDAAVSELALHRAAARALLGRRAQAAGRGARLRGLSPPPRAARPRHDARRFPRRSRRRVGAQDAAALGRSRGARGRLGQGPLLVMNGAFRRVLRRNGYFNVKSTLEVSVKVNAVQVPRGFYDDTDGWHITYGDSDQDH